MSRLLDVERRPTDQNTQAGISCALRHCTRGKRAAASSFRRWQLSRSTHYLIRELTRRNEQVTIWLKRNQAAHPVKTGAQVIVRQAKTDTEVMIQAKVVARYNKHALLAE